MIAVSAGPILGSVWCQLPGCLDAIGVKAAGCSVEEPPQEPAWACSAGAVRQGCGTLPGACCSRGDSNCLLEKE